MQSERNQTRVVRAKLDNGATIDIQTSAIHGEEDVANMVFSFKEVTERIENIAEALMATLKRVKPQSASVEFGIEMAVEAGHLTALLVKGTSTANVKITLQWGDTILLEKN